MGRHPGESIEQWFERSSKEYHAAWDALGAERRRISMIGYSTDLYPLLDEGYDGAMDRLEAADAERGDAAVALDRERRHTEEAKRMRDDLDRRRMGDDQSTERSRRPVYQDFRDGNNEVDWAEFRAAAAAWDRAHTAPGSVQDPFNNLPGE